MKQQLVEGARLVFRKLPLSPKLKKHAQGLCFTHFPFLFRHLSSYQLWSLQHPDLNQKILQKMDLPALRAEALASGHFASDKPAILMVSHSLGGGTEHHLQQLTAKLRQEGHDVWALRSIGRDWIRLLPADTKPDSAMEEDGLIYHFPSELPLLIEQLSSLNLKLVHVHHLLGFPKGMRGAIQQICQQLDLHYDFTVHDYFPICPRFTLYDEAVRGYCGEPDVKRCQGCVASFGSAVGKDVDVAEWRGEYADFLNRARHVYTPDLDVKTRLERYLPAANIINRPHWDETPITPLKRRKQGKKDRPIRILTLGGIAPHKGSMVLKECAEDAKQRGLPLEFTLIGFSDIDWMLKKHLTVTGPYKPAELPEMLQSGGFDAVFFPAVWPETFNYTLSEVLHFGLYPVSFEIGAIARRIQKMGWGTVLPYANYRSPKKINDALLNLPLTEAPVEVLQNAQTRYESIMGEYYEL